MTNMQWGVYPLLDEDLDDDGLDLIEHARATGVLYSGELSSGVQSTGPWYNPGCEQRLAHLNRLQRALVEQAKLRRLRIEQLYERDRLEGIRAQYAALEAWREHQNELDAHMRLAHRYAEMLRTA